MNSIETAFPLLEAINKIFSEFIQESNFIRAGNKITWPDFNKGINKALYMKQYEELLKNRQYSFLLVDKSFIQIFFEFTELNQLKTIKYGYYPYPIPLNATTDILENYFDNHFDNAIGQFYYDLLNLMSEEIGLKLDEQQRIETIKFFKEVYNYNLVEDDLRAIVFDKIYDLTNYSHFRMDYDSTVTTHHKCEFQFGAIKQIRLPISKILTPFIFIDFIFRYFFKKNYPHLLRQFSYKKYFIFNKQSCLPMDDFVEHSFYKII